MTNIILDTVGRKVAEKEGWKVNHKFNHFIVQEFRGKKLVHESHNWTIQEAIQKVEAHKNRRIQYYNYKIQEALKLGSCM